MTFVCRWAFKHSSIHLFQPANGDVGEEHYRQLCLIRTDVDPKFMSELDKIRIMCIVIMCKGRDWDLPIVPV